MICRIDELKDKEVISMSEGTRIGYVCDVELDSKTAMLTAVVIYGKQKFFGFFGKEEDFVIPWGDISLIGEDTILVNFDAPYRKKRKQSFLSNLFELK